MTTLHHLLFIKLAEKIVKYRSKTIARHDLLRLDKENHAAITFAVLIDFFLGKKKLELITS